MFCIDWNGKYEFLIKSSNIYVLINAPFRYLKVWFIKIVIFIKKKSTYGQTALSKYLNDLIFLIQISFNNVGDH